jgi:hypothetical protein
MNFRETVCDDVTWIQLAQDGFQWRDLVNIITKLRVCLDAGNFLTS